MPPIIDKSVERFDEDGVQQVFAIAPFGNSETREERLKRWHEMGTIDLNCDYCKEMIDHPTLNAFMPRHRASTMCRSGRRSHCTCDTCF
jgi:hypothetical protein